MFYGQIMMQKYLEDPAISFCAIGDVTCDRSPLQVTEFGQGKAVDQLISKMYLEGGGGGNAHESYDLAAYFYANYVSFKNCQIPFFFVTGDEKFFEITKKDAVKQLLGKEIQEDINSFKEWERLKTKYNTFLIKKPYGSSEQDILNQWYQGIGEERVLNIVTPKACIDVMLGAIALTSGSRDLEGYVEDMKKRGQDEGRIKEVTNALKKYNEKLLAKKVEIVRYEKTEGDPNIKSNANTTSISSSNKIDELREDFQKMLKMEEEQSEFKDKLNELSKKLDLSKIPRQFLCPLTNQIMADPVMTVDGLSFERKAIEMWLSKNEVSPITGETLESKATLANIALKRMIEEFVKSNE